MCTIIISRQDVTRYPRPVHAMDSISPCSNSCRMAVSLNLPSHDRQVPSPPFYREVNCANAVAGSPGLMAVQQPLVILETRFIVEAHGMVSRTNYRISRTWALLQSALPCKILFDVILKSNSDLDLPHYNEFSRKYCRRIKLSWILAAGHELTQRAIWYWI